MTSRVDALPAIEAVLTYPPSSVRPDSMPFRLTLFADEGGRASSLVRLRRPPTSPTDVVEGTAALVTRVGMLLSRWELHACHDEALLATGHVAPIRVPPYAPLGFMVRLFGLR